MNDTLDAILAHVVIDAHGCWLWQRSTNRKGYAQAQLDGRQRIVHRATYELVRGPIPAGLQIDHLCRVRHCLNPDHMEPVTSWENTHRSPFTIAARNAAKTHCKRGHEFTTENTYINRTTGSRQCRECVRLNRDARRGVAAMMTSLLTPAPSVSSPAGAVEVSRLSSARAGRRAGAGTPNVPN